ncbi:MAG: hypothetical protein H6555_08440 [Lewinellaceae bacterium]|nr:hypothetical protein [Lewinellaceae bacterium]
MFLVLSGFSVAGFGQEPPVSAGEDSTKLTLFDLLNYGEVVDVNLDLDLTQLLDQKNTNDYLPAQFRCEDALGRSLDMEIKIRSRGKYRRKNCVFPPLKLNFPKEDLKALGLRKHDEFKLVTHCVDGPEGKENLLREYLVYQLYARLSPVHIRVQLLRIRYRDTQTGNKFTAWGILVEDEKTTADRYKSKICEDCFSVPLNQFDPANLRTMVMFQYLIGNTDWSIPMARNLMLLVPKDGGPYKLVPYDFDFSGIVNSSYASPDSNYGLISVRERMLFALPYTDQELEPTLQYFESKQKDILSLVRRFKLLSADSRIDIGDYLDSYWLSVAEEGIRRPNR